MKKYRIAVIEGDGIGKEVVPEGIRVIDAAARKAGIEFDWEQFPWSCGYYQETGRMMPEDGLNQIRHHDAIFLGAVGFPGVPDHISLWGLLIPIRRVFEQYANIRPVRLMPGIESPLRNRKYGDIDFIIVRENNEGEYSSVGGECTKALSLNLRFNNPFSRVAGSTGFCGALSKLPTSGREKR